MKITHLLREGPTLTKYLIRGGKPLFGEITVSGAKNAAVAGPIPRRSDRMPIIRICAPVAQL